MIWKIHEEGSGIVLRAKDFIKRKMKDNNNTQARSLGPAYSQNVGHNVK